MWDNPHNCSKLIELLNEETVDGIARIFLLFQEGKTVRIAAKEENEVQGLVVNIFTRALF